VATALFGALVLLAIHASSASAQTFPAEWNGDWEIEIRYTHAGEIDPHLIETVTDSICTGDVLGLEPFEPLVSCSVHTIDAAAVQLSCTGQAAGAGCAGEGSLDLDLTRTGDTLAGWGAFDNQLTGSCPGPALDEQVSIVGVRVEAVPTGCGPPASSFIDRFVFLPTLASFQVLAQTTASVPALGGGALLALGTAIGAIGWRKLRGRGQPVRKRRLDVIG
jgi:hypothetical protein